MWLEILVVRKAMQYRACFRVLGMKDRNACDIAQATHEAILEKVGLLESLTKLVYGDHAPTSNIWEGVYLDDLLVVQKCSMEEAVALDGTFPPYYLLQPMRISSECLELKKHMSRLG